MDEQSGAERTQPREQISFWVEMEKFWSNVIAFGSTSEEMSVISRELNSLYQECDLLHADVRDLKAKLNQTAVEFGLQPLQ